MNDLRPESEERRHAYAEVRRRIESLLDGETDWIAALATVACELHHSPTTSLARA